MGAHDYSLQQLRQFVVVAEELHFRRAASRLHIAQPPLSRQIRTLEDAVGVPLLERTTRRVALTVAGTRFLEDARAILRLVDSSRRHAVEAATGQLGCLKVGFVESAAYDLLPPMLAEFMVEHPRVELELHEMHTSEQVAALLAGNIDVGILRPPVSAYELQVEVLFSNMLVAAVPVGHRLVGAKAVSMNELADEPFIAYSDRLGQGIGRAVERACAAASTTLVPRVVQEASSTPMLMTLVAAGVGVALVPEPYSQSPRPGVAFVALEDMEEECPVAMAWRQDGGNRMHDALLDTSRRVAAQMS